IFFRMLCMKPFSYYLNASRKTVLQLNEFTVETEWLTPGTSSLPINLQMGQVQIYRLNPQQGEMGLLSVQVSPGLNGEVYAASSVIPDISGAPIPHFPWYQLSEQTDDVPWYFVVVATADIEQGFLMVSTAGMSVSRTC